jgi:hypothetical protein
MAHVVELYRRTPEAEVESIARFVLVGARQVRIVGLVPNGERFARELVQAGVAGADRSVLTTLDGIAFLHALPAAFHGSRLWATQPLEVPDEDDRAAVD